jgi:hypothetical protein
MGSRKSEKLYFNRPLFLAFFAAAKIILFCALMTVFSRQAFLF